MCLWLLHHHTLHDACSIARCVLYVAHSHQRTSRHSESTASRTRTIVPPETFSVATHARTLKPKSVILAQTSRVLACVRGWVGGWVATCVFECLRVCARAQVRASVNVCVHVWTTRASVGAWVRACARGCGTN